MAKKNLFTQYAGLRRENYVLSFGRLVTNLGSMVWPVLTLILSQKMAISATATALTAIAAGAVLIPSGMVGGKLADHINKKHIIVCCDIISVALYAVCAFIPLSFVTIALIVVAGACQYIEHPVYTSLIADITPSADRERAYSLQYLGGNIGLVASPAIAGFLFADYLWLAFLISGLSIGVSTLLIGLFVKNITPVEESHEQAPYQRRHEKTGLGKILWQNKPLLIFILIMGIYQAAYIQYAYMLPLDLGKIHGEDGALIYGSLSSLNGIVVVIATPLITRFFAKVLPLHKCLIGQGLLMAAYFVFLVTLGSVPVYYAAMILFTVGEVFVTIGHVPYIASRTPETHRGRINGALSVAQGLFQGISVCSSGILYDALGHRFAWFFVILVAAVAFVLCVMLSTYDRVKYPKLYNKAHG